MASLFKNGFTLLGLAAIAGLGYYLFVMQSDSTTTLDSDTTIGEAQLANEQFLREINELQTIKLEGKIFSDQRFRSFVDFSRPVPEQLVGRSNQFAPAE